MTVESTKILGKKANKREIKKPLAGLKPLAKTFSGRQWERVGGGGKKRPENAILERLQNLEFYSD